MNGCFDLSRQPFVLYCFREFGYSNSSIIFFTSTGCNRPYTFSPIITTGASPQAPTQRRQSNENFPSGDGLIIHSEVSIGYDIPWRQVNQILIDAALNTPGVVDDPRPFVLETSLSDWYPVYQINAYIKQADKMAQIYSDLHQNIQDKFNEAGIEIMSPHYMAVRDGNETTTPKEYQKSNNPSNKAGEESKSE